MNIKPGGARIGLDALQDYTEYLVDGLVPTDGIQYSSIATFGTTAVELLNKLIDPGFSMQLKKLQVGLTQQLTGLNGSFVGSVSYYWEAREEYYEPRGSLGVGYNITGNYLNITGTYTKGVGTLLSSEDTFSGYVPVASLSHAPVRVRLVVAGLQAAVLTGRVKNSSFVDLVGMVLAKP